jgi:hypothetical protein
MSNSSPLTDYSITSSNLDTITISTGTVDLSSYSMSNQSNYSYTNSGMSTITLGPITSADMSDYKDIVFTTSIEWDNCFPDWGRIQNMCKQYPSLEIALRNFQTIYKLVKDDYDNPTPKK